MSSPNQFSITVNKVPFGNNVNKGVNKRFLGANWDAVQMAGANLNKSGLLMWLWLSANVDGYYMELSRQAWVNAGWSKNSYYTGFEELLQKGYIVDDGGNHYQFYEVPRV